MFFYRKLGYNNFLQLLVMQNSKSPLIFNWISNMDRDIFLVINLMLKIQYLLNIKHGFLRINLFSFNQMLILFKKNILFP
jgi:hypothetical protein